MTPAEVAKLLAKCAAYDQRTVGEADVLAWHEILKEVGLSDALEAVRQHYAEHRERIMPADVTRICRDIARDRHRIAREASERRSIEADSVGRGPVEDRSAEVTALVQAVVAALPVSDSDRKHQRARDRARRERGRPERLAPKPRRHKKPRDIDPINDEVATIAVRYLRDGYAPDTVAERFGIARRWCERTARRLGEQKPIGWCGECTFKGRLRSDGKTTFPCPECNGEAS